jgi:hypothetical protein
LFSVATNVWIYIMLQRWLTLIGWENLSSSKLNILHEQKAKATIPEPDPFLDLKSQMKQKDIQIQKKEKVRIIPITISDQHNLFCFSQNLEKLPHFTIF